MIYLSLSLTNFIIFYKKHLYIYWFITSYSFMTIKDIFTSGLSGLKSKYKHTLLELEIGKVIQLSKLLSKIFPSCSLCINVVIVFRPLVLSLMSGKWLNLNSNIPVNRLLI